MDSPMPSSLVEILDALEDPRGDRTKLHPLTDILVLAVICGADSFVAIAYKRLAADWDRNYRCQLIGLGPKPIWMQSPWSEGTDRTH